MNDIRLQTPDCPLCGGTMRLIESRARVLPGKLVNVYKCNDCDVHYPCVVDGVVPLPVGKPPGGTPSGTTSGPKGGTKPDPAP